MSHPDQPSDEDVFSAFQGVPIDRDNVEHYRGMLRGKLLINRCQACGRWVYPHRPICPSCLSWEVKPTQVSGLGCVYTFTLIQQERDPNSLLREPIVVAAVELEEQAGLRYLAPIVGCRRDQIALEMPVRLVWVERDGRQSVAFEPIQKAGG